MNLTIRPVVLALPLLLLGACGEEESPGAGAEAADGPLTVEQAAEADDGEAEVRGYVLVADGAARLCSGLAGSMPPQCGEPSLEVRGLDPATLTGAETDQGLVWTGETVLRGELAGGVLTVAETP